MTKKASITEIGTGYSSGTVLNDNLNAINDKLENTISRDGSTPNTMEADLDLNNNDIINVNEVDTATLKLAGATVSGLATVPDWEGAWVTATPYTINDLVREDGNVYICLEAHTSGTFATDLAANKWELFASKGSAGAGTGDLLSTNNLSDLADADTALSNLGGGTAGIELFKGTSLLTTSVTLTISNNFPAIDLQEQDGMTTHNVVRHIVNGDLFSRQTLDNSKSFVSTDYTETRGASGVSNYLFNVNGSLGWNLDASGVEIEGGFQLNERASAAHTGAAGKGEIWLKNSTPNALMFTDDAGTSWDLTQRGGMILLATQTLSGASSATFTSSEGIDNSTYTSYKLLIDGLLPATDSIDLYLRTSSDDGVSYDSGASDYYYQRIETVGGAVSGGGSAANAILLTKSLLGNASGEYGWAGEIIILNAPGTGRTRIEYKGSYHRNDGGFVSISGSGFRDAAAAVNAFQLICSSGNLDVTVALYGVK